MALKLYQWHFVEENAPVIWKGPMLGKMLTNFFTEVRWGDIEYLILDLPPGTGDVALDVHTMLPSSKEIIVTTPHPYSSICCSSRRCDGKTYGSFYSWRN